MKFYFLIPFLFLSALCPIVAFNQENIPVQEFLTESPAEPSPNEFHGHEIQSDPNYDEHSPLWADHGERESDSFQTKFFNMLFILGLLIGFMLLASWALKRMMRTKMTQLNTSSFIKVIETRNLSPRAALYLVEVEEQTFLIGESHTNIACLASIPSQQKFNPENKH